jgi:hypothetical protein
MRINIALCRHCILGNDCEHKKEIKRTTKNILKGLNVSYNCKVYRTLLPIGSIVSVELFNMNYDEGIDSTDGSPIIDAEWESIGWAKGKIISCSNGYYIIELDESVKLMLPVPKEGWKSTREVEVKFRSKRLNKIKIIDKALVNEVPTQTDF